MPFKKKINPVVRLNLSRNYDENKFRWHAHAIRYVRPLATLQTKSDYVLLNNLSRYSINIAT